MLELDAAGIHVAEYLTILPPPEILQEKLHRAIEAARSRIDAKIEAQGDEEDPQDDQPRQYFGWWYNNFGIIGQTLGIW